MENYVIQQLRFVRAQNIKLAQGLTHEQSLTIIEGHNNNILWNLGHLYVVLEKFAFGWLGAPTVQPENFQGYFGNGSSPKAWDAHVPSLETMIEMLENQMSRIETQLPERLAESFETPYKTASGFQIDSVQELLSFSIYHEGMHLGIMKSIAQKL